MTRRAMTKASRVRIFDAASGKCHLCGLPIRVGDTWHVEHVVALECGGSDDDANCRPAHVDCHKVKTRADHRDGAKVKRIRAREIGAHVPKQRIPNRGFPKCKREPREKPAMPPRRPLWIALDNPRGSD